MNKPLEQLREIFLTEVDEETRIDNEQKINEWEQGLIESEAFVNWQEHDVTKRIAKQARETYKEASLVLASNRNLTETQRHEFWAKQDAALWLISLIEVDAKSEFLRIEGEIRVALNANV